MRCPICDGRGALWGRKDKSDLFSCCGTLRSNAWKDRAAYEAQYLSMSYHADACELLGLPSHVERFHEHLIAARSRLRWLRSKAVIAIGTKIIDIGASNGAFAYAAQRSGCAILGIEPNGQMCEWARQHHGVTMQQGTWKDVAGEFDLAVATDVIEHLLDPELFLVSCSRHSKQLYIETPEFTSGWTASSRHVKPKEHVCLFSGKALRQLAQRAGWTAVRSARPVAGKLAVLFSRDPKGGMTPGRCLMQPTDRRRPR